MTSELRRIKELDYLKGVLILLVISFHLVYFEQLHPFAKQVVYTFHMPGFLLISGYLMNVSKPPKDFLRTLLWLAIPYIIMESGYIVMASLLPINEHIDHLTPAVFLDRLLLHPLGPYWYLHTLIICGAIYKTLSNSPLKGEKQSLPNVNPSPLRGGWVGSVFIIGLAYFAVFYVLNTFLPLKGVGGSFSFSSALYFLAGAAIRQSGTEFLTFFRPTWVAVVAFALLVFFSVNPNQASIYGALIAYTAISSLLWLYKAPSPLPLWGSASEEGTAALKHSPKGGAGRGLLCFLGRNSLVLYIFSPIFTLLCKRFVPYLQFDPTGLIFLMVSLVCCVGGSLLIAWLMDKTGTSKYFFGRKAIYSP